MHDTFKVPCVLLGFGLPDENAHAPDEHIALENYFGGIKAVALFYEHLRLFSCIVASKSAESALQSHSGKCADFAGFFQCFCLRSLKGTAIVPRGIRLAGADALLNLRRK